VNKKKRILIIDDEKDIREILRENFHGWGFETLDAQDGERGLMLIEAEGPPDFVLTDLVMPQKEGLETIMEIRRRFPSIKLIAMSGGGFKNMNFLDAARKLGAHATISKPIDMDALEKIVIGL
jgi:DNA-binding NtrC family response regulator